MRTRGGRVPDGVERTGGLTRRTCLGLLAVPALAAERTVNATWLRRRLPEVTAAPSPFTSDKARYKPLFGAGDRETAIVRGISRYGELTIDPGGASAAAAFPREEHAVVVLGGSGRVLYGEKPHPVKANDFFYLAASAPMRIENTGAGPLQAIVMGFRLPRDVHPTPAAALPIASIDDVPKQVVGNHPPTTLYQLLMGGTESTRDRLATGHVLTSLFVMEFAPGGTNFPHHHATEEEVYLLLDGSGDMVAGGGMDGVEGRHPAVPGDAYFFRLNCTVGFYNNPDPSAPKAHILAVRSKYPFR